jgi:hypothetical protein
MSNKSIEDNLFDNSMTRAATSTLGPEELDRLKKIGEKMYGTIDFESSKVLNNLEDPIAEATGSIVESIKSGQHISTLEDNEKLVLEEVYGKEWYLKYGYIKEDLDNMITLHS